MLVASLGLEIKNIILHPKFCKESITNFSSATLGAIRAYVCNYYIVMMWKRGVWQLEMDDIVMEFQYCKIILDTD